VSLCIECCRDLTQGRTPVKFDDALEEALLVLVLDELASDCTGPEWRSFRAPTRCLPLTCDCYGS